MELNFQRKRHMGRSEEDECAR